MKKQFLAAVLLASVVVSRDARADEKYGTAGQLEAGGLFGIFNSTEEETLDAPGDPTITTTRTTVAVQPQVGYYVSDGLELIGALELVNLSEKVEQEGLGETEQSGTIIGLGAGGGYFFGAGNLRLGPQMILKFQTIDFETDLFEVGQTAVGANLGVFAKVAVGGGGVLSAGLALDYLQATRKVEFGGADDEQDGTITNVGARVGFFVFF